MRGEAIGKSLNDIFKDVKTTEEKILFEAAFHKHNIDRMAQGKPIFGESVTAADSRQYLANFAEEYPHLVEASEDILKYMNNLLNEWAVPSGLTSRETADLLQDMYKNYVPSIKKVDKQTVVSGKKALIPQIIKKAEGGSSDLVRLDQSMLKATERFIKNSQKNEMMNTIANGFESGDAVVKGVLDVRPSSVKAGAEEAADIGAIGKRIEETPALIGDEQMVNFYRNGKPMEMLVDKNLYAALKPDAMNQTVADVTKILRKYISNPMKALINITF